MTDPIYIGLLNRILLAGGNPRFLPLVPSPTGWRLDRAALLRTASPKVRVVLMMSPSMPTGCVLDAEDWAAVATLVQQTQAWLLYDAAMERILFGRPYLHPASLPGMADRTISVGALSKEYRMIGWRIGWVVAPVSIIRDIALVGISNVVCQVGIAQSAAVAALQSNPSELQTAVQEWQKRHDLLVNELEDLPIVPAHGGWSLLLDCSALGIDSVRLARHLLEDAKIAATPMTGWGGPDSARYLRFVVDASLFGPFSLTPDQRLILDTVSGFANDVLRPAARAADEAEELPDALLSQAWELGIVAAQIPAAYGGSEARSPVTSALLLEALAHADPALALAITHSAAFALGVVEQGSEEQRDRYLPMFCGKQFAAASLALMEPTPLFEACNIATRAKSCDSGFVLTGTKCSTLRSVRMINVCSRHSVGKPYWHAIMRVTTTNTKTCWRRTNYREWPNCPSSKRCYRNGAMMTPVLPWSRCSWLHRAPGATTRSRRGAAKARSATRRCTQPAPPSKAALG